MVVFETLFISIVAAPIGIFLSYSFISYFGIHGIDLSSVGEGIRRTWNWNKILPNYLSIII